MEWFDGTLRRSFIDALRDGKRRECLGEYEAAIAAACPAFPRWRDELLA
ncbi:hypothetical protein [Rhizobium leguminosarum]|nr:hypothetical protein [Rhizobium leguminosarum]WHO83578.1 hypothetical protein QMO81_006499 [Rhizobium leguminosarum]